MGYTGEAQGEAKDGKYTDEEFADGSKTDESRDGSATTPAVQGEYTDVEPAKDAD